MDEEGFLKEDILKGIDAIAEFIGEDFWRTQRLCSKRAIPCAKQQGRWIASKRALRAYYERLTASGKEPPATAAIVGRNIAAKGDKLDAAYADELIAALLEEWPSGTRQQLAALLSYAAKELQIEIDELNKRPHNSKPNAKQRGGAVPAQGRRFLSWSSKLLD